MARNISINIIVSFLFVGWACMRSPNESPSSPHQTVLISTTFEKESGEFTLSGWKVVEPGLAQQVTGERDTPGPTSIYSVKLMRDPATGAVPGLAATGIASDPEVRSSYKVEFWAKGKGTLLMRQHMPDGPHSQILTINASQWYLYTFFPFSPQSTADTITLTFRPFDIDPVPYLFIDNVSVTYMKW